MSDGKLDALYRRLDVCSERLNLARLQVEELQRERRKWTIFPAPHGRLVTIAMERESRAAAAYEATLRELTTAFRVRPPRSWPKDRAPIAG